MSDLRTHLDRIAERIAPEPDAFDRLDRARVKRQRTRRISAGVLAFVIAIAGSTVAFVSLRSSETSTPGSAQVSPEDSFLALWPERTLEDARLAQERVNAGEDAWRLDPFETAERFGREVLAWPDAALDAIRANGEETGEVTTTLFQCVLRTECFGQVHRVNVTLEQLVGAGSASIWSITRVDGPGIDVHLQPRQVLQPGDPISISITSIPEEETQVQVLELRSNCVGAAVLTEGNLDLSERTINALVERSNGNCSGPVRGYVYGYVFAKPEGASGAARLPLLWDTTVVIDSRGQEVDEGTLGEAEIVDFEAFPIFVDLGSADGSLGVDSPPEQGAGEPEAEATYSDPEEGWSLAYRDDLVLDRLPGPGEEGVALSNFPIQMHHNDFSALRGFPEDGALLRIWRLPGVSGLGPSFDNDSEFPLTLEDLQSSQSYVGGAEPNPRYGLVRANGIVWSAAAWFGPQATVEDRRAIRQALESLRFPDLTSFTTTGDRYFVLDYADSYPEGSVVSYDRSELPMSGFRGYDGPFSLLLVHAPGGFYAVTKDFLGNGNACQLAFDDHERAFFCAESGEHWDVFGRSSEAGVPDLLVLPAKMGHDGHLVVDPFGNDPSHILDYWD